MKKVLVIASIITVIALVALWQWAKSMNLGFPLDGNQSKEFGWAFAAVSLLAGWVLILFLWSQGFWDKKSPEPQP